MVGAGRWGGGQHLVPDIASRDHTPFPSVSASPSRLVDIGLAGIITAIGEGELVPHYQPLVSFETGRLVGVEALARWEQPGGGRLFPDAFVPRLEEGRRVTDLTAWMIDRACADLDRWRRAFALPRGFSVAVNVSATELVDGRLVRLVSEALLRHPLAEHGLCLELTETATVEDPPTAARVMHELRALGIRLALDDFGSGAANRDVLERLPFDMVKIDQSYVASLGSADSLAFIIDAIALAAGHSIEVVAEGIETAEQFEALRLLGCCRAQGFGVGPPAPADVVLTAWMPALTAG